MLCSSKLIPRPSTNSTRLTHLECTALRQTLVFVAVIMTAGALSLYHTICGNFKEDICLTVLHYIVKLAMYGIVAYGFLYSMVNYGQ